MKHITMALLAVASAAASAQFSSIGDTTPYGLSVRGGIFFPIENAFSNAYGNTLLGLGVDYTFTRPLIRGGETFLSVDYITSKIGQKGNVFPVMLNQRFYNNSREFGSRTYGFVGLGVVFRDTPNNDNTIGGRVGGGLELSDNLFTEASLLLASRKNGLGTNGVGLYLGYRF